MSDNPALPAEQDTTPGYSRVTADQAAEMAHIRRINPDATYAEIAAAVGVASVSTVSYWLKRLERNTVPDARNLMKAEALPAAMGIVDQTKHKDPRVAQGALKTVLAMAGVQEGSAPVQVGVQVIVGSASQPAGPDPFDNIQATIVDKSTT